MKQRLIDILNNMKRYNEGSLAAHMFGLDPAAHYDALVVAPGWKPTKIIRDDLFRVSVLAEHSYVSGYLVERDGLKIAWIQTAAGACNLIDELSVCAELDFDKLIFVGAVGSLTTDFRVGDFCTPLHSVEGVFANAYLLESLSDYAPFGRVYPPDSAFVACVQAIADAHGWMLREAPVFCTDSIALEYSHLDEIKGTGAALIEMETSSFYRLADLFEKPAVALLAVSDNSASGDPLVGRNRELDEAYHRCRSIIIPTMICEIAQMDGQSQ